LSEKNLVLDFLFQLGFCQPIAFECFDQVSTS